MRKSWRFIDWTARAAHVAVQFQWEPRDCWIGVFWRLDRWKSPANGWDKYHGPYRSNPWALHAYICLLPMIPLHVYVMRTVR